MYQLSLDDLGEWEEVINGNLPKVANFLKDQPLTQIYPHPTQVFKPLKLVQPDQVRVVMIAQDPYYSKGQANGLAFSTNAKKLPSSLLNMQKEIKRSYPESVFTGKGDLAAWADQGVLLINSSFTVREGQPLSHTRIGWRECVEDIIRHIESLSQTCVYLLLGRHAQAFAPQKSRNPIIKVVHPSGQSCWRGFIGSDCFVKVNSYLHDNPINWSF